MSADAGVVEATATQRRRSEPTAGRDTGHSRLARHRTAENARRQPDGPFPAGKAARVSLGIAKPCAPLT